MTFRRSLPVLGVLALGGCALKGDVRRVERELQQMREETARADSAGAVELARQLDGIIALQADILDSLEAHRRQFLRFQGEARSDLTNVQRQLVQIQELTGQSQQRLSELRAELERRSDRVPVSVGSDSAVAGGDSLVPAGPSPEELYSIGRDQLRRGSMQTARAAFQKLLEDYPDHSLAPDAQFQIGQTFEGTEPDSAAAAYERVADEFPDSPRAPAALYKLGLLAETRGQTQEARVFFQRVTAGYPNSPEASLARDKLQNLNQ